MKYETKLNENENEKLCVCVFGYSFLFIWTKSHNDKCCIWTHVLMQSFSFLLLSRALTTDVQDNNFFFGFKWRKIKTNSQRNVRWAEIKCVIQRAQMKEWACERNWITTCQNKYFTTHTKIEKVNFFSVVFGLEWEMFVWL